MAMTKREARKILAVQDSIHKALNALEATLTGQELDYFQAYYGAHIRQSINGYSYGSMPIKQAEHVLGIE